MATTKPKQIKVTLTYNTWMKYKKLSPIPLEMLIKDLLQIWARESNKL
jgi:hypothetical protein